MTRSLKVGLAGLAAVLSALPASAQLRVAKPADIVDAVASCMAATSPGSINVAQLAADGWGSAPAGKNKAVATPMRLYGRKQNAALIMIISGIGADGLCTATARIPTMARYAEVERALVTRFGGRIVERKPGETMFFAGGEVVSLSLTGTPGAPAVRIGVMQMPQEKK
ncbi:MAG: hypothetical protein ABIP07_06165 [Sphingomicrobium sp.]